MPFRRTMLVDAQAHNGKANGPPAGWRDVPFESGALITILVAAAALRLWSLDQDGWGAEYYTAAVRSMLHGWHNFFFAAFDPAGFISVDKPPVALWVQVISARLFGFSPLSVLVPQAVIGVVSVWLTWLMVRRPAGAVPALLAALLMALSPLLVAVNRTNNMDSCLLLCLLLSAVAFLRAAETGERKFLFAAAVALGIAFNVKMLAALVVLPAFVIVYGLMTPITLSRRCLDLGIAAVIAVAGGLSWAVAVELTSPDARPYVGGTRHNSMFELILGHNAANRFISPMTASTPTPTAKAGAQAGADVSPLSADIGDSSPGPNSGTSARSRLREVVRTILRREFVRAPPGAFRLGEGLMAAQFAWFLPFSLAGVVLGLRRKYHRTDFPDATRSSFRRALWFLVIWAATCWALYSSLGGIIHYYYLVPLVAPVVALSGIGMALLWQVAKQRAGGMLLLAAVILVCGLWQAGIHVGALAGTGSTLLSTTIGWDTTPLLAMLAGGLIAVAGLFSFGWRRTGEGGNPGLRGSAATALVALSVLPTCWALSTVLVPGPGLLPSADIYRLVAAKGHALAPAAMRQWKPADTASLARFLVANRGGSRYLLATTTTMIAAPLIIESDEAVLVRGGYHGLDRTLDPDRMASLVKRGDLRFAMVGDVSTVARRMGGDAADKPLADWIRLHGKRVDPVLWRVSPTRGSIELFDLHPEMGLVAPNL